MHYIVKYWHLSDSWWTKGRLFVSRNIRNSCSVANDNKKLTNCGSFLSFKSCMYDLIRNNPSTSIAEWWRAEFTSITLSALLILPLRRRAKRLILYCCHGLLHVKTQPANDMLCSVVFNMRLKRKPMESLKKVQYVAIAQLLYSVEFAMKL